MSKKGTKSYTHPNIKKPSVPFCDLGKVEQNIIRTLAKALIEKTPGVLHKGTTVEAAIELLNKGILRIIEDGVNKSYSFLLFDFDKGKYVPLCLPIIH